ncbi:MAG: hypothetical protein ACYC54_15220 [Sedimentisphaerales bacterium]
MAKIIFSLEEAKEILLSNIQIPNYISDIKTEGQTFSFTIETGLPLKKHISPIVSYSSFENGIVTLKITINYLKGNFLEMAANLLISLSSKFKGSIPHYIKFDYPIITVDLNILMTDKNIVTVHSFKK